MFENNELIQEINFTNFNTSHIKNMDNMFKGCIYLNSLDLSNFDTSSVTSMANMFQGCSSLKSLDLSNFNTSSVTSMSRMFSFCNTLAVLDISNFVMNNETDYKDMFIYLENLRYISLIDIQMHANPKEVFLSLYEDENEIKELLVCQNDTYIENSTNFCCEKNNNSLFCKTDNYITLKYKEDSYYPCGFGIERMCAKKFIINEIPLNFDNFYRIYGLSYGTNLFYQNRDMISFINIRNSTYMGSYIPFKIEKNDILEIHFVNSPHTLENGFWKI